MTDKEFEQVFTALALFWPKEKISDKRKAAWRLALKPYPYQEGVREKILAYARSGKGNFFPDVADLTAGLTPEVAPKTGGHVPDWIDAILEKEPPYTPDPITRYASEHGITWGEAKKALEGRA